MIDEIIKIPEDQSRRVDVKAPVINTADFLPLLDPKPTVAEEKYRTLRAKLIFYFEVHGRDEAPDLADEVVVRVLRKLNEGIQIDAGGVAKYCFGVARNVLQEARKSRRGMPLEEVPMPQATSLWGLTEVELLILQQQILELLPLQDRDLLLRYYLEDRRKLASDLNLTPNALRIRVYRVLEQLKGIAKG